MGTGRMIAPECPADGMTIRIEGIHKTFGGVKALDGIDLDIKAGQIFALLGPNGSGKTTLVRILTTLLEPSSGRAAVHGYDVIRDSGKVRPLIGLAGQYPAVDENLSGMENLVMIGRLYHLGKQPSRQRARELLEEFDLTDAAERRVKTYSGGMRRRLDLAAAIVGNPSVLFLDEPTTGLDPRSRLGLWEVIKTQASNCNTVFLTTQYLEEADRLAQTIAIMDRGKIIRSGTPKELKDCCGGGTRIRLTLMDRKRLSVAAEALRGIVSEDLHIEEDIGSIGFPAPDGPSILAEVVRRMDAEHIELADLGLAQPTLDDVFLSITGHTASEESGTGREPGDTDVQS